MGMTMTQKILAAHAGLDSVMPGELIAADLDMVLGNDITAPVAIDEMRKADCHCRVFDRKKIALVPDHFTPNKDIKAAENSKYLREFAKEQEIENYFEIGEVGIEHCLLPEQGLLREKGPELVAAGQNAAAVKQKDLCTVRAVFLHVRQSLHLVDRIVKQFR